MWMNLKSFADSGLVKPDERIVRINSKLFNPINGRVVFLYDARDVEAIFRAEGKYPNRWVADSICCWCFNIHDLFAGDQPWISSK